MYVVTCFNLLGMLTDIISQTFLCVPDSRDDSNNGLTFRQANEYDNKLSNQPLGAHDSGWEGQKSSFMNTGRTARRWNQNGQLHSRRHQTSSSPSIAQPRPKLATNWQYLPFQQSASTTQTARKPATGDPERQHPSPDFFAGQLGPRYHR